MTNTTYQALLEQIHVWASDLGFDAVGVSDLELNHEMSAFNNWLGRHYQGDMAWLAENIDKRLQPPLLVPGACRVISVRLNYLPAATDPIANLKNSQQAYISRYALGRDYHKLMRKRLAKLGKQIELWAHENNIDIPAESRAFVDSAPVLERPLAEKAGLGWTGKHTLILNQHSGSWFFLGELFTNIPLPINEQPQQEQCGSCEACIKVCPTDAFIKPWVLDARRCLSYQTIENSGPIPIELREAMGNRIYGCDDCQLICPWNKDAPTTAESDFQPRANLAASTLLELFHWTENEFLVRTEGSAIRRAGYEKWQRNIAVALGNAEQDIRIIEALSAALKHASPLVAEHIEWALGRQQSGTRRKRKTRNSQKITELAYWPAPTASDE